MRKNRAGEIEASIEEFMKEFSAVLTRYAEQTSGAIPAELLVEEKWCHWSMELNERSSLEWARIDMESSVLLLAKKFLRKDLSREEMDVAFYLCRYGSSIVPRRKHNSLVQLRKHIRKLDKEHRQALRNPLDRLDANAQSIGRTIRLWFS